MGFSFSNFFNDTGRIFSPANFLTGGGANLLNATRTKGKGVIPERYFKSIGVDTQGKKGENKREADAAVAGAQAAADAAVKQAEFEASTKAGLERLALKRKRGFGSSMIVNPTFGSTSTLGS